MGQRIGLVVVVAVLFAMPMAASAASPWADEATYSDQAVAKLKYGLTNTLLGWTSLFRTPRQAVEEGDNIVVGIGRGLVDAVGQTVLGAVHAVTFPIPQIDIPLPAGGTDVLQ